MTQTIINVPAAGAFDPTDIVITDNTSGAFLIKDDAGSPHEYMRIDTTTGSKETIFTVDYDAAGSNLWKVGTNRTANSGDMLVVNSRNTGLGFIEGVFLAGPASSQVWVSGPSVFRLQGCSFAHNMTGSQSATTYLGTAADWIVTRGSPSEEMIKFEHDSNMTFTLDDGSGATFKVVNDAGSPKTFLSITDGGSTTIDSETATTIKAQGHQYLYMAASELQIGATGKYNVIHTGTPIYNRSPSVVALGATSTTKIVNIQDDGPYKTFKLNPSTTSQTFTFEFQDGAATNSVFVIEQSFVIQNYGTQNCTIQATVTSGRGSALGKDLSAGGSTSGELVAGMTLNAGKSALFKAVKWNKEQAGTPTTADNEFMFQTIMVEA